MSNKIIGTIKYSKAARLSKPNDKNSQKKVYAVAQSEETVNLDLLAKHMTEHGSPFTEGTISGVLKDSVVHIIELMCQGKRLELGDLGTFFTTLKCDGADSSDEFTTSLIKAVVPHIAFNKSVWGSMRDKVDFELVPTRELQAQARKKMTQDNDEAIGGTGSGSGSGSGNNGGTADPGDVTP